MQIAMQANEIALLQEQLKNSSNYLEFGSGGSTVEAARQNVANIYSVESDKSYILKVSEAIKGIDSRSHVRFYHADIGPTGDWGIPLDTKPNTSWFKYYLSIWDKINAAPDLVLVDGRFRVACCLIALLGCSDDTRIMLHDFYDPMAGRKNYKRVLEFSNVVVEAGNLVILQRNTTIDRHRIVGAFGELWSDFW